MSLQRYYLSVDLADRFSPLGKEENIESRLVVFNLLLVLQALKVRPC